MELLTDELSWRLLEIGIKSKPYEMCGVLYADKDTGVPTFKECPNVHPDPKNWFRIDAKTVAGFSIAGHSILAYVHSHPNGSSQPSPEDIVEMNLQNKPYIIVGCESKTVETWQPTTEPLVGRNYVHGKQDCYTIVRDYYQRECGIILPDFDREDRWWENADGPSLYAENFKQAGFHQIEPHQVRKHDVMLCYWGQTQHVNHALIYLGSEANFISEEIQPTIGTRLFLHHPYNSLSTICILGEERLATVAYFLRHRQLL